MYTGNPTKNILWGSLIALFFMMLFSWKPMIQNLHLAYPLSPLLEWDRMESGERFYNTALILAKEKKYTESNALLERLIHLPSSPIGGQIAELYGDTLYLSSGSISDVRRLYIIALEYERLPRIEEKITLLTASIDGTGDTLPQQKPNNTTTQSGSLSSDQTILTSTIDSLEQSESEKQKYLYPINGSPRPESDQLSDIRSFVDEGIERVDW